MRNIGSGSGPGGVRASCARKRRRRVAAKNPGPNQGTDVAHAAQRNQFSRRTTPACAVMDQPPIQGVFTSDPAGSASQSQGPCGSSATFADVLLGGRRWRGGPKPLQLSCRSDWAIRVFLAHRHRLTSRQAPSKGFAATKTDRNIEMSGPHWERGSSDKTRVFAGAEERKHRRKNPQVRP